MSTFPTLFKSYLKVPGFNTSIFDLCKPLLELIGRERRVRPSTWRHSPLLKQLPSLYCNSLILPVCLFLSSVFILGTINEAYHLAEKSCVRSKPVL